MLTLTLLEPWFALSAFAAYNEETATRLPVDADDSYSFDVADLDGVNGPDVFIANRGQSRVLINDGTGTFADETASRLPAALHTTLAVVIGDVDGINGPDVLLVGDGQNRLLINNGAGVFADLTGERMPVSVETSLDAALGDVDGDGDLDAVIANRGSANQLLINDGSGTFSLAPGSALAADADLSYGVALGDADGNGSLDIFFANFAGQNRLHINNNLGMFSDASASLPAAISGSGDAAFLDVDGDGDNDIATAEGGLGVGLLINSDGAGNFQNADPSQLPALSAFVLKVAAGDVNFDGAVDLVAGALGQDHVLFNDGSGTFSDVTASQLPVDDRRSFGLALVDADSDLDLDLLVATPQGQNRFYDNGIAAPRVQINISPDYIEVTDTVTIDVNAFDEDGVDTTLVEIIQPDASAAAPSGGPVTFTFVPAQIGVHTVRVTSTDLLSNVAIVERTFLAQANDVTDPTVGVSADPVSVTQGESILFTVTASDDRGVLSRSLTVGGNPVPLDSSGQATYAPLTIGSVAVEASAADAAGNTGTASTTVTVLADVEFPVVVLSATPDPIDITNPIAVAATATDNIAVSAFTVTVDGPPGGPVDEPVTLDGAGNGSYTPYVPGTYTFTARATDPAGNETVETATVLAEGIPDAEDPVVNLIIVPGTTVPGGTVTLTVDATDNIFVLSRTLTINGSPVALDGAYQATYTPSVLGSYTAVATAADPTGNTGSSTVIFSAVDPATDVSPPVVSITAPVQGSDITDQASFIGTATDLTLVDYTLAYRATGSSDPYTVFHTGSQVVENGLLGNLDTTILENGLYDIRLQATDINGLSTSVVQTYLVDGGGFKPGIFTISYIDLQVPVAGIPITIRRSYDSRRRNISEDFGNGWNLEVVKDGTYTNNRDLGLGWTGLSGGIFGGIPCQGGVREDLFHITEIRFSDVEFYKFAFEVELTGAFSSLGCEIASLGFTQVGGVPGATLEVLTPYSLVNVSGGDLIDFDTLAVYNPDDVRLTTIDGREYDLDENLGLQRIGDANGNSLFINNNGVVHSSGQTIFFTRDGAGRITAITDPAGQTINYSYDAAGNLVGATDRVGNTTQYFYVADNYLERIEDPLGNTPLRNEYDTTGRLVAQIDALGNRTEYDHDVAAGTETITERDGTIKVLQYTESGDIAAATVGAATSTFTYDARGNKLTETDPNGNTRLFTYNANDQLLSETDPLGNTTSITYNARGAPLSITDSDGNALVMTYDSNNNPLTQRDAGGNLIQGFSYDAASNPLTLETAAGTSTMTYDADGNMTQITSPSGLVTAFGYDSNGRKNSTTVTRTVGGSPVDESSSFTYDANGKLLTSTDPLGGVTTYAYNGNKQMTSRTDALGRVTTYEYNSRGDLFRVTHPDSTTDIYGYDLEGRKTAHTDTGGGTTFFEYDTADRLERVIYPDGAAIVSTYDLAGNLLTQSDTLGHVTTYAYDALNRVVSETGPLGNVTTWTYTDDQVKPATVVNPLGNTTSYNYERSMWLTEFPIETILPDGNTIEKTFGANAQVVSQVDPRGNETLYTYDAAGRLLTVTDALGAVTTYAYDEVGNRISQTDANSNTTSFTYDALGRMLTRTLPGSESESWVYDAVGNMLSHTDFNGDTTTFEYDARDRLVRRVLPEGGDETYTYTAGGELATAVSAAGTWTFGYDARGRIVSAASPDGVTLGYTYDSQGNRTSVTTPGGVISFAPDAMDRVAQITDPDGGVTTYSYDSAGNITGIEYPNGTEAVLEYNTRNQTVRVTHLAPGGATLGDFQYTLDAAGNRTQMIEAAGRTLDYSYDLVNRLTQVVEDPSGAAAVSTYGYDPVGNVVSIAVPGSTQAATYDANSRMLTFGTRTFSYDDNGNLTDITDGADTTTFTYDSRNRLIGRTEPDGTVSAFVYDTEGNRISRTVAGTTTGYVVDHADPSGLARVLLERAGSTTTASYVYGHSPVSMTRPSATSYLHPDALGSTRLLTDASGVVTDSYAYDAWGNDAGAVGSTENELRFTGARQDPVTGMYYLQARYYDPEITRFISRDPFAGDVMMPITLQPYVYSGSNPVNMIDPTGEFGMISISISISIVSTLSSIAYGAYNTYTDVKEIYDKIEEFAITLPNMRLNEEASRAELGITPSSVASAIVEWDIAKVVNLGGGAVEQAYGVSYEMASTMGKAVSAIHAYNAATWMKYLPEHEDKPAHYVSCGYNRYIQKTYVVGMVAGVSALDAIPKMDLAKNVMAAWLAYFNFLVLAVETAGDMAGSHNLLQPADDPSLFGPEPACPSL